MPLRACPILLPQAATFQAHTRSRVVVDTADSVRSGFSDGQAASFATVSMWRDDWRRYVRLRVVSSGVGVGARAAAASPASSSSFYAHSPANSPNFLQVTALVGKRATLNIHAYPPSSGASRASERRQRWSRPTSASSAPTAS